MSDERPPAPEGDGPTETPGRDSPSSPSPPDQEGDDGQRPMPVRMVMEAAEPEGPAEGGPRLLQDPSMGIEWTVRVSGRSSGGILPLRTIPLLHLTFSPPEGSALPQRRGVFPGEDLSDMEDGDLLAHFRASGPLPPSETRRDRNQDGRKRRRGRKPPRK